MKLFSRIFGDPIVRQHGRQLYEYALTGSRLPSFYKKGGVPDSVDGRFDLLIVHVWLIIRQLNRQNAQDLGQEVFDFMFADMDNSLRELGISDTKIGKNIKGMAKIFYARAEVYNTELDAKDAKALGISIGQHFFPESEAPTAFCRKFADYILQADQVLAEQNTQSLLEKGPCYPPFA